MVLQCEDIAVDRYLAREADPERAVLAMVGDLHRMIVYPALGFQIEQAVPAAVLEAMRVLVEAGYGARLLPGYDVAGMAIPGSPPRRPATDPWRAGRRVRPSCGPSGTDH